MEFEISDKNMPIAICGQNNVGKTNTLRAINLFFNPECFDLQLDIPVVILKVQGSFLAASKWHKSNRRKRITIQVERIIQKEELESLNNQELDSIIKESLAHNEFEYALTIKNKEKNKAEKLGYVLYKCPRCKENYKLNNH